MRRASFFGDVCWHPLFHWNTTESCVERPGEKGGLRRLTPLSVILMRPVHATGPVGRLHGGSVLRGHAVSFPFPCLWLFSGRICLPQIFHCRRMQKSGALLRGSRFFRQCWSGAARLCPCRSTSCTSCRCRRGKARYVRLWAFRGGTGPGRGHCRPRSTSGRLHGGRKRPHAGTGAYR